MNYGNRIGLEFFLFPPWQKRLHVLYSYPAKRRNCRVKKQTCPFCIDFEGYSLRPLKYQRCYKNKLRRVAFPEPPVFHLTLFFHLSHLLLRPLLDTKPILAMSRESDGKIYNISAGKSRFRHENLWTTFQQVLLCKNGLREVGVVRKLDTELFF